MADTTVAKEIFKRLHGFPDYVCSGDMEKWHCLDATGSTITRKARKLHPEFALVDYRGDTRIAWYKARRSKTEQCPCPKCLEAAGLPVPEAPQTPKTPPESVVKPKWEYKVEIRNGERIAVPVLAT